MTKRIRLIGATAVVTLAAAGTAAAIAVAAGGEDETPIVGAALERASTAALAHTGGGRVTGTEVGDEDAYYEVEITRDDGSQVDVHLDRAFSVVDERDDDDTAEQGKTDAAEDDADDGGESDED